MKKNIKDKKRKASQKKISYLDESKKKVRTNLLQKFKEVDDKIFELSKNVNEIITNVRVDNKITVNVTKNMLKQFHVFINEQLGKKVKKDFAKNMVLISINRFIVMQKENDLIN